MMFNISICLLCLSTYVLISCLLSNCRIKVLLFVYIRSSMFRMLTLIGALFIFFSNDIITYLSLCFIQSLGCVQLFATPWAIAHQASWSMGFPMQEYWSGLPFLLQGSSQPRDQTHVSCIAGRTFKTLYHQGPHLLHLLTATFHPKLLPVELHTLPVDQYFSCSAHTYKQKNVCSDLSEERFS